MSGLDVGEGTARGVEDGRGGGGRRGKGGSRRGGGGGSSERRKWRGTRKTPLLHWIDTHHLHLSLYISLFLLLYLPSPHLTLCGDIRVQRALHLLANWSDHVDISCLLDLRFLASGVSKGIELEMIYFGDTRS